MDSVDSTLYFLQSFLSIKDPEQQREIAESKYAKDPEGALPHKKFKASLKEAEVSPGRRDSMSLAKEDHQTHDLRGGINKRAMLTEMGISEEGVTSGASRGQERRGLGAFNQS